MDQFELILERINNLCEERNISINKMLFEAGLKKSVVDNIKKKSMPSVDKMSKISGYFGVQIDYILGKTDTKKPALTSENGLSGIDKDISDLWNTFTPDEKAQGRAFLQFLKDNHKK